MTDSKKHYSGQIETKLGSDKWSETRSNLGGANTQVAAREVYPVKRYNPYYSQTQYPQFHDMATYQPMKSGQYSGYPNPMPTQQHANISKNTVSR